MPPHSERPHKTRPKNRFYRRVGPPDLRRQSLTTYFPNVTLGDRKGKDAARNSSYTSSRMSVLSLFNISDEKTSEAAAMLIATSHCPASGARPCMTIR